MHDVTEAPAARLLAPDEPPAWSVVNGRGAARLLLVCDHASRAVPRALAGLGLPEAELGRHIAWDIGAAEVARHLSRALDAPLVLAGYSRLVIDLNRATDEPTSIVEVADGTTVPGNRGLGEAARAARRAELHDAYHAAVARELAACAARGVVPAFVSVHSFTPAMKGIARPWHLGILWDADARLAVPLLERLRAEPGVMVGDNQPYSGRAGFGYTCATHAAARGLPHVLLEVRQDLVDSPAGAAHWSSVIARALRDVLGRAL